MKKLKKKNIFDFGSSEHKLACLYLRKTFSNIFVTLTDLRHRTIVCKTSGSSGIIGSKRRKRVPYALESIVKALVIYFKLYSITHIWIILKMRLNAFYYTLVRELRFRGLTIRKIQIRRKIAFNGVRARKRRRV